MVRKNRVGSISRFWKWKGMFRRRSEGDGCNSEDEYGKHPAFDEAKQEKNDRELAVRVGEEGLDVKIMLDDGNCFFRAIADQVYHDPNSYNRVRQECVDHIERNPQEFSPAITEDFEKYCRRKRRDQVQGNNIEILAASEVYHRTVLLYTYENELHRISIHEEFMEDGSSPVRLTYNGDHYNSLVKRQQSSIGPEPSLHKMMQAENDAANKSDPQLPQKDSSASGAAPSSFRAAGTYIRKIMTKGSQAIHKNKLILKLRHGREQKSGDGAKNGAKLQRGKRSSGLTTSLSSRNKGKATD